MMSDLEIEALKHTLEITQKALELSCYTLSKRGYCIIGNKTFINKQNEFVKHFKSKARKMLGEMNIERNDIRRKS